MCIIVREEVQKAMQSEFAKFRGGLLERFSYQMPSRFITEDHAEHDYSDEEHAFQLDTGLGVYGTSTTETAPTALETTPTTTETAPTTFETAPTTTETAPTTTETSPTTTETSPTTIEIAATIQTT
ncbi:hypothetical protein Dsin_005115 [Dipteronia sinensis]|uniref:Uncharacterized protein n=1 Tax=Dipteronia sinensis TaxID=43782 RepID=A0AAE0AW08_9ROSI|nr:hypothetical protein Dsin_005115 [Dipteronia sinensis]